MRTTIRLKLEMAGRVRTWIRARPEPTELYTTGLARLEELLTRAETLAVKHYNGRGTVKESVERRDQLRRTIRQEPLRHLARIARAAAHGQPGITTRFRLPGNVSHKDFLIAARDMAAEAANHRELFQRYGMAEDFPAALTATLDEYEKEVEAGGVGQSAHVGAGAELRVVTAAIMEVVLDLDAMYQYRFRDDAEQLASWESARNIPWAAKRPSPPAPDHPPIEPAA